MLILPVFTTSSPGPIYSKSQLAFTALASLVLWAVFVFFQTVRHATTSASGGGKGREHPCRAATLRQAWVSFALRRSLVAVVGLAKVLSPAIEPPWMRPGRRRP